MPTVVPLWVALFLRGQQKCRIMPPAWLTLEKLNECKEAEENDSGCTSPPHSQYIEISTLLLQHAAEDIPKLVRKLCFTYIYICTLVYRSKTKYVGYILHIYFI